LENEKKDPEFQKKYLKLRRRRTGLSHA